MDVPLQPPARIQPISSTPLPLKKAQTHLSRFIDEKIELADGGGLEMDPVVAVQLKKLADALKEERQAAKKTHAT